MSEILLFLYNKQVICREFHSLLKHNKMKAVHILLSAVLLSIPACSDDPEYIPVSGITINNNNAIILSEGEETRVSYRILPENVTDPTILWESADTSVAVIDMKGMLTGKKGGKTTIIARAAGKGGIESRQTVIVKEFVLANRAELVSYYNGACRYYRYDTLFTDPSCSRLKDGIGKEDILKTASPFYRHLAYAIHLNQYEREFRIADYKPFPSPEIDSRLLKTKPFSLHECPTGMVVENAQMVLVFASNIQKDNVFLRVMDFSVDDDPFARVGEYPVHNGLNEIHINDGGLVYLDCRKESKEEVLPAITLHFVNGKVNGYYDQDRPEHKGRGAELLQMASYDHFDIMGEYAHLTFQTEALRKHTRNLDELIGIWNRIVYHEAMFMGLEKYNRVRSNRLYAHHTAQKGVYYRARPYRTVYTINAAAKTCDTEQLSKVNLWGPAHEIGHMNQTQGFVWTGMLEVTNNIMSMYITRNIFGLESRMESLDGNHENNYTRAWRNAYINDSVHNKLPQAEKLIPFWQLQLFFGDFLGKTPLLQADKGGFYPDLYELIRQSETDGNDANGKNQLNFVYCACKAAGTDLTDFFTNWGFLTAFKGKVKGYSWRDYQVEQSDIDNTLAKIRALSCPKPEFCIEYITDATLDIFRNRMETVKGSTYIEDGCIKVKGWKNTIVYEIREGGPDSRLTGIISPHYRPHNPDGSFTLCRTEEIPTGSRIYAVSYRKERIEVIYR